MSNPLREYTEELFTNASPTALNLIMQTFVCAQCRRRYRAPSAEPMVQLRATRGTSNRHIRQSQYPYHLPPNLPRRIVEVETHIEYCEHCFGAHDPRQAELFSESAEIIPLPFNGKPIAPTGPAAPKPQVTPATLEDF
jgi:hypothetical protein